MEYNFTTEDGIFDHIHRKILYKYGNDGDLFYTDDESLDKIYDLLLKCDIEKHWYKARIILNLLQIVDSSDALGRTIGSGDIVDIIDNFLIRHFEEKQRTI